MTNTGVATITIAALLYEELRVQLWSSAVWVRGGSKWCRPEWQPGRGVAACLKAMTSSKFGVHTLSA